ncbi:unnamed protein product, partial [Closterium sp. NIES-53]
GHWEAEGAALQEAAHRVPLLRPSWVDEYGDEAIVPNWLKLQGMGVGVYALNSVQINKAIYAMYVTELSDEGACYSCVPGDAGVAAAALGAIKSAAALGACESSVAVSLADPTGGPVVARASIVLPCPAVPSGSLSGLHLPTFSTNLVSNATLQDVWVDTFTPGGQRVAICMCSRTGRHLATSGDYVESGVYVSVLLVSGTLPPESPLAPPPWSPLTAASPQHALPSPCLWPSQVPALPPVLACTALPFCVEGRQRAVPHSSEFPPTTSPLQTLHMDVWSPAPVGGTDQERYFLLVVDDYTRYTTDFPLCRKADISSVLIPWIHATRCQLRDRFSRDLPVLRLHSDRDGDFSFDLLAEFCRVEGIRQSFTLLASPQQNGIAERRIGLIMEVARTSMIHVAAPHFLWPFAVRYAAHHLNLWPRVPLPEILPKLRWTG